MPLSCAFKKLLRRNVRKRLRERVSKYNITLPLFDYSSDDLVNYLEPLFTDGMTWENYGSYWNIDHIRPICSFNLTDINEIKQMGSLNNLRPLTKEENNIKSIEDAKIKHSYTNAELVKLNLGVEKLTYGTCLGDLFPKGDLFHK